MAGEIDYQHDQTGEALYCVVEDLAGDLWDTNGSAFATRTVANWTTNHYYDIALTETPASSYHYVGSMPATGVGWFWLRFYVKGGANSAISDFLLESILFYWDATTLLPGASDVREVSGDSTAADNLELQYDTTGVTGDTFPATQAQVGNLSTSAGGLGALITAFAKVGAEPETNTYTSTQEGDGVYHIVEDDGGNTDFYYQATVSAGGSATSFEWKGYVQSNADTVGVYYWNWTGSAYKQITTLTGSNGTTDRDEVFKVPVGATGTGTDQGKVRLRFLSTTSTAIATDTLLCEYSQSSQSVGYANGAIWIDTTASNTNTTDYVDGTADNPVSTIAAANTLAASLGLNRFEIAPGSTVTLAASQDDQIFQGHDWTLALGSQSVSGSYITGARVSGISSGASPPTFTDCTINATTVPPCEMRRCGLADTITAGSAGNFHFNACFSEVAGTGTPVFDFGAALNSSNLNFRHYSGGIEIEQMGTGTGTYMMSLEGHGQLIINANCSATSTVSIRGNFTITDNASGAVTLSDAARFAEDQTIATVTTVTNQLTAAAIATGIWQDTTAGDFTTAGSIGKSLFTSGAVPGAAGGLFIAGTNAETTITTALNANIIGDLSGSVGSVTGAVGSVTGAVGSVTGAVGSVGAGGIVAATFGTDAITAASLAASAVTEIQSGLSTVTTAQVNAAVDTALADYDPPTKTEMDTSFTEIKGATWSASTDTLELLYDKIALAAGGTGSKGVTITINDGSTALDGVSVKITTDVAGSNIDQFLTTDSNGIARVGGSGGSLPLLDDGTYYAWLQLSGYEFSNPQTITVS